MLSVKCKKEDASSLKKNIFFPQKCIPKVVPQSQASVQFSRLGSHSLASFQMSSVKVLGPEWPKDEFFFLPQQCYLLNGYSPPHHPFSQHHPFYTTQQGRKEHIHKLLYNVTELNFISVKKVTERRKWPKLNIQEKRRKIQGINVPVGSTHWLGSL